MNLTCVDLVEHLSAYLDNELNDELTQAAKAHLATCQNCRVVLDSTEKTITLFREHGRETHIPASRKDQLYHQIAAAFAQRD